MKHSDYWRKRAEILEAAKNKSAGDFTTGVEHQFSLAQKKLDEQIEQWYGRFAKNNQISLADARQWLTGKDLAEFKWDVTEYIKYGKAAMIEPAFIKQLENASARFHISKLEALRLKTQNTIESLYGQTGQQTHSLLSEIYRNNYYHAAFALQQGFGVGWDIAALNLHQVESVLSKPWTLDKETFSDRIWTQKQSLLNEVHTQLTQNMILGKGPDDAISAIAKKFNTSRANAGRVIMTESAYFANEAQKNAYKELGVEEFEVVATLDGETCKMCGSFDGKHMPMSQFQAGITAPPFHPWCRCCTAPYFSDNGGERAARDEDGKTYYVPADMKYEDWKAKYVNYTYDTLSDNKTNKKVVNGLKNSADSGILSIGGGGMINTGASGAIPRSERNRMEKHAELYYEEIRKRAGDIEAISKTTGFSADDIRKVKEHVFLNYYDLGGLEPERFEADYDMAVSWQRLIEGKNIQEMDLVLLNHELVEYGLMREKGMSYAEAHREAEKLYNYIKYVKTLDLEEGIK